MDQNGREEILKDFLEAILDIRIKKIELGEDTILLPEDIKGKGGSLDILATLEDGTKVDIEMQNKPQSKIERRTFFYSSKMYLKYIEKGTPYDDMVNTIVIFITNYKLFPNMEEYHTVWKMTEQEHKEKVIEGQEFHFIELKKFRESEINMERKLDQWLTFIDYRDKEMVEMAIKRNEKIKEADEEYKKLIAEEKVKYLAFLDDLHERDYISGLVSAEKEGSMKEKNNIAKKMLENNIDIEMIIKVTGLSKEEIEKLR